MMPAVPLSLLSSFALPCMAFQKTEETAVRGRWDRGGGVGGCCHSVPWAGDMFGRFWGTLPTQLLPAGLRFLQSGANANGPGKAAPAGELGGSFLGALGKY